MKQTISREQRNAEIDTLLDQLDRINREFGAIVDDETKEMDNDRLDQLAAEQLQLNRRIRELVETPVAEVSSTPQKKFEHQEARARRILGDLAEQLEGEFHRDQITPDLVRRVTFRYSTPCGLETNRTITDGDEVFAVVEDGRVNIVAPGSTRFDDPELLDTLRVIVHNNMTLESVERRESYQFHGSEIIIWFKR